MSNENNLMNALLSKDRAAAMKMDRKKIHSKKLSRLTGKEFDIEIRELTPREVNALQLFGTEKNGDAIPGKMLDMELKTCVKGITFPDLTDKQLQEQYEAENPERLCEILFGMEAVSIFKEIMAFSGDEEVGDIIDELKN